MIERLIDAGIATARHSGRSNRRSRYAFRRWRRQLRRDVAAESWQERNCDVDWTRRSAALADWEAGRISAYDLNDWGIKVRGLPRGPAPAAPRPWAETDHAAKVMADAQAAMTNARTFLDALRATGLTDEPGLGFPYDHMSLTPTQREHRLRRQLIESEAARLAAEADHQAALADEAERELEELAAEDRVGLAVKLYAGFSWLSALAALALTLRTCAAPPASLPPIGSQSPTMTSIERLAMPPALRTQIPGGD